MRKFKEINQYNINGNIDGNYSLKADIKTEIFNSLEYSIGFKFYQLKKIWDFLVFYNKNTLIKKFKLKNKKIEIIISSQKKFEFEYGNILAFCKSIPTIEHKLIKDSVKISSKPLYIDLQFDINRKMRAILIDWLIDVHCKFKLVPATLYLTVNSIDRFLSLQIMVRQKLQLLGISSMLLASKYEEIYAPETRDFVYISDNAYSKEDIFNMEILICTTLDYVFHIPSPLIFIAEWSKVFNASQEEIIFASYILDLHLLDYDCIFFQTDIISISSLLNSISLLNNLNDFIKPGRIFLKLSRGLLNIQSLNGCLPMTNSLLILNQNEKKKLTSLKRKYNHIKYKEVSEIKISIFFKFL